MIRGKKQQQQIIVLIIKNNAEKYTNKFYNKYSNTLFQCYFIFFMFKTKTLKPRDSRLAERFSQMFGTAAYFGRDYRENYLD